MKIVEKIHNPCLGIIRIRFGGYNLSHFWHPFVRYKDNIISNKRKIEEMLKINM